MIGWEEWVTLPQLKLPLLKVKIDTGAKISALHAVNIAPVIRNGNAYVKFTTHPFINDLSIERTVCLPIFDERRITSAPRRERGKPAVVEQREASVIREPMARELATDDEVTGTSVA